MTLANPLLSEGLTADPISAAIRLAAAEQRAQDSAAGRSTMNEWRAQQRADVRASQMEPSPHADLMQAQALQMSSPPQASANEFLQNICTVPEEQEGAVQPPQPVEAQDAAGTEALDAEIVVGYVLPSQRPTVDVIDEQKGSSCPQMLARVFCCLTFLLLAAAGLLIAKHHGHIHVPRHLPRFDDHHLLGPGKLPVIILSATMLCVVAALIKVCRPQRRTGDENGHSPHRSEYLGGAACACFLLGMPLVGLVCLAMSPGGSHLVHHMMRFLHAGRLHPALHLIFTVCLFIGMLSFFASGILYVRKVPYRRDAGTLASAELDRHTSCGKRVLIALFVVLGLLLFKGFSHGGLNLPMHIPGFRPNFDGRHGPQEWQDFSDLDSEGEGDDNDEFEAGDGSDHAEDEEREADDSEASEASDNSDYAEDQEGEGDHSEGFESDDGTDDEDEVEARQQTKVKGAEQKHIFNRRKVMAINEWEKEPMASKQIKMNTKMRMEKTIDIQKAEAISRTSVMV